jgi:hypothetical protein
MSRRRLLIIWVVSFGMLGLAIGGFVLYMAVAADINDSGSPRLAKEWKSKLEGINSLDEAKQQDPEILGQAFRNGDWVFGYARDSHNCWHRGGGTLVVKDCRGDVHVFFGHVCGPHCGCEFENPAIHNLDEFYKDLRDHWGFVEQKIP